MKLRFQEQVFRPENPDSFPPAPEPWLQDVFTFCSFWFSDAPVWEARTSGSTGKVGSILLQREQIRFSATLSLDYFQFDPQQNGFALALPARSAGGFMLLARAFLADVDVLLFPPASGGLKSELFPTDRKWFLPLLPIQLSALLSNPFAAEISQKLSGILLGGGPLDSHQLHAMAKWECPVFHSYGMTETASHVAIRKVHPEIETGFQPLPGVEIRLNQQACLEIRAGIITRNEWLPTNDLAEIHADGRFSILGRLDFTINSGGLKIQPEIEKERLQQKVPPNCRDFDLLGLPDDRLGEKLVLVAYTSMKELEEIESALDQTSEPGERMRLPRAYYFLPEGRPLLPGGKTDFIRLRKIISDIVPFKSK
jgi:O-succinylbenzoic acid--CoA ligase